MNALARTSLVLLAGLSGCAAIESKPVATEGEAIVGVAYRLPVRQVLVKLVVKDNVRTASIEASEAFGDTSTLFVAKIRSNQASKTQAEISVNPQGLLSGVQKAELTTKLAEALSSAAALTARIRSFSAADGAPNGKQELFVQGCIEPGVYTWNVDASELIASGGDSSVSAQPTAKGTERAAATSEKDATPGENLRRSSDNGVSETSQSKTAPTAVESLKACGVVLSASRIGGTTITKFGSSSDSVNGFYYRVPIGYKVKVSVRPSLLATQSITSEVFLTLVNSESPVAVLPARHSIFADASGRFTFVDGQPTLYSVTHDSELLGIAKLPAEVLSGYVQGVKNALASESEIAVARSKLLSDSNALAMSQFRAAACAAELEKDAPRADVLSAMCK